MTKKESTTPMSWKVALEIIPGQMGKKHIRKCVREFFGKTKNLQEYQPTVSFSDHIVEVGIKIKTSLGVDLSLLVELLILDIEENLPKQAQANQAVAGERTRNKYPRKRAPRRQPLVYSS